MTSDVAELFRQAAALPGKDRAELAGLLLESLEGEPDEGVEGAWGAEIERRIAELDRAGPCFPPSSPASRSSLTIWFEQSTSPIPALSARTTRTYVPGAGRLQ